MSQLLWPQGLVLQDREDKATECSCPDCPHAWLPCVVPCTGFPVYFATFGDDPKISTESRIRYPCFYFPGCCDAWKIENADVNGVPMKFVGRDCESCCMPSIKMYDWTRVENNEPAYIGKTQMRCSLCNCCGEYEMATTYDKDDNVVLRRYATFCCGRAGAFNDIKRNACCFSCWKMYQWNVRDKDEHFRGKVMERYHTCTFCHPYQWGYSAESLRQMNLSEEHQKLLPGFLLAMMWRGAMVREEEDAATD